IDKSFVPSYTKKLLKRLQIPFIDNLVEGFLIVFPNRNLLIIDDYFVLPNSFDLLQGHYIRPVYPHKFVWRKFLNDGLQIHKRNNRMRRHEDLNIIFEPFYKENIVDVNF